MLKTVIMCTIFIESFEAICIFISATEIVLHNLWTVLSTDLNVKHSMEIRFMFWSIKNEFDFHTM